MSSASSRWDRSETVRDCNRAAARDLKLRMATESEIFSRDHAAAITGNYILSVRVRSSKKADLRLKDPISSRVGRQTSRANASDRKGHIMPLILGSVARIPKSQKFLAGGHPPHTDIQHHPINTPHRCILWNTVWLSHATNNHIIFNFCGTTSLTSQSRSLHCSSLSLSRRFVIAVFYLDVDCPVNNNKEGVHQRSFASCQ